MPQKFGITPRGAMNSGGGIQTNKGFTLTHPVHQCNSIPRMEPQVFYTGCKIVRIVRLVHSR
jgi:hypothetical protein